MSMYRPTRAIIDLEAVRKNVRAVSDKVSPASVMAIVKADAYGHGMIECAKAALEAGAAALGVATVDEAVELRKAFPYPETILLLGPCLASDAEVLINNYIDVALGSLETAEALNKKSKQINIPALVHLKIDTGMGRFGFWYEDLQDILPMLKKFPFIKINGMMTHFSESDIADKTYTNWQLKNFYEALEILDEFKINPDSIHAANSGAIHQHPDTYFDMVRLGVSLYGYYPDAETSRALKLYPAMTLATKVIRIRHIPAGQYLSYGRLFKTERDSKIGILPIGYADGFIRKNTNNGYVLVRGKRAPLVGRVCMDQSLIDLTDIPHVKEGDEVVIIGKQQKEEITMEEVAARLGTITYEVTCLITKRVPRIYINQQTNENETVNLEEK